MNRDRGERIFHFIRGRANAANARTGDPVRSFGNNGYIDLRENLGVDPRGVALQMTIPGAVYKNLLILGRRVNESYGSFPGHVRAFNAVTGELEWTFHTIPQAGEFGHDSWSDFWRWQCMGRRHGRRRAWLGIRRHRGRH